MLALVAFLVAVVAGGVVLSRRLRANKSEYQAVPLLSAAETEFYRFLLGLYGPSAIICPKVRLLDLIRPLQSLEKSDFQVALNRVSSKHVDFVILRVEDLGVLGVVELDDRSHERKSRADRDVFVDDVLGQAGIRVCRVKVRREYNLEALCGQLNEAFADEIPKEAGA